MRTIVFTAAVLLAASVLQVSPAAFGQEPGAAEKKDEAKPVPAEKAPEAKPGEGEKPEEPAREDELAKAKEYYKHPDTGVEVILKNGTVFEGVARMGVRAEAKEMVDTGSGGRMEQVFTAVEGEALKPKPGEKNVMMPVPTKRRAGIRIWYFRDTKGFIFIDFADIVEIRVTHVLTYLDSKRIFQAIEEKEKKLLNAEQQVRDEEKKRGDIQRQADREDREKELAKQKGLDAQALEKRKVWRQELLGKFPPGAGWSKDRKTQIMVKMVKGIDPSPEEKEFYNRYKEWEEAVKEEEFLKGGK